MRIVAYTRNLMVFALMLLFTSAALAEDVASTKSVPVGKRSGLPLYPKLRKALCKECNSATNDYNEATEELSAEEADLEAMDSVLDTKDKNLNQLEAKIAGLKAQYLKKPSPDLGNQISNAETQQKQLAKEYGQYEQKLSKQERSYNKILKRYERAKRALNNCEKEFCNKKVSMASPTTNQQVAQTTPAVSGEVGLVLGNQNINRSGTISAPSENFSGSNSTNNFQTGLQARLFFAQQQYLRFFLLANMLSTFNATNTLLNIRTDSFSNSNSLLKLRSIWLAHLIIGLQSAMFSDFFRISGGLGGAVVNQELESSIAEDVTTTNKTSQTSLVPSALFSLDFKLCKTCLAGHDLNLSGQLSADRYPSINSTVTTPLGNTYRNSADSKWNFAEALVLSMQF